MIPQAYFDKVREFFNGDAEKTWKWFQTRNPSLGGVSPLEMIKAGKVEKLKKIIDSRMQGYFP